MCHMQYVIQLRAHGSFQAISPLAVSQSVNLSVFLSILSLSFLVDVNHAEGSRLILLAFVFDSEDHNFVSREAVTLLFGHLQY